MAFLKEPKSSLGNLSAILVEKRRRRVSAVCLSKEGGRGRRTLELPLEIQYADHIDTQCTSCSLLYRLPFQLETAVWIALHKGCPCSASALDLRLGANIPYQSIG